MVSLSLLSVCPQLTQLYTKAAADRSDDQSRADYVSARVAWHVERPRQLAREAAAADRAALGQRKRDAIKKNRKEGERYRRKVQPLRFKRGQYNVAIPVLLRFADEHITVNGSAGPTKKGGAHPTTSTNPTAAAAVAAGKFGGGGGPAALSVPQSEEEVRLQAGAEWDGRQAKRLLKEAARAEEAAAAAETKTGILSYELSCPQRFKGTVSVCPQLLLFAL